MSPSPTLMPQFKVPAAPACPTAVDLTKTPAIPPKPTAVVADLEADTTAKIVRPGTREVTIEGQHDGVVKAKHLVEGQEVRAWLHGGPKGSVRTVDTVTRSEDGATVTVTFSSPHPTTEYKAAYRFFDEALVGTPVFTKTRVPALVAYEEV